MSKKPRKPLPPRKAFLKRSTTRIAKVNPERKAKRQARYKRYLSSKDWRDKKAAVRARSGGRCEQTFRMEAGLVTLRRRCPHPATSTHHITYARFGGKELLEDLAHLCRRCHDAYTVFGPTWCLPAGIV